MKVIWPALFTMLVMMALVSTFMTTPLLQWILPRGSVAGEGTVRKCCGRGAGRHQAGTKKANNRSRSSLSRAGA